MHPFFLPIPTFAVAGVAYPVFAALMGARRPVVDEARRDVDAVESRIAELAEAEGHGGTAERKPRRGVVSLLSAFALAGLVVLSAAAFRGTLSVETFRTLAFPLTLAYFALAAIAWIRSPLAFGRGNMICYAYA